MQQQHSKAINATLWIAQSLLAVLFLLTGGMKLLMPIDLIAEKLPWVAEAPVVLVRFIGLSEVLGAAGLILPAALRIKPELTPIAAVCVAIVMVLGTAFHLYKGEVAHALLPATVFFLALFIAWGRTKAAPIASNTPAFISAGTERPMRASALDHRH